MDEAAFLARLSRDHPRRAAHPGPYRAPRIAPSWAAFKTSLEFVGGSSHVTVTPAQLPEAISAIISFKAHQRVVASAAASRLVGPMAGVETASDAGSARQWADVDLAIIVPEMGVCENAAMLLSAVSLPERGLPLLAQHVLALLDLRLLVPDMHEAYLQMAHRRDGQPLPHHLTWVSGPSKTADIEQALVIGAHGCRSMLVLPYAAP